MICPVCEGEYEPGITQCPTDDTPLVEKITSPHDESEASFVSLHNFGSPAEAEMVNDILTHAFSPLLSATWEGAMIMVDERDVDRAREVYQSFFGADTTPLTGGTTDDLEDVDEE